jgi:hypothetical protein
MATRIKPTSRLLYELTAADALPATGEWLP